MAYDKRNGIIVRTGYVATSQTTCDIQSGDEGIWNNSGTFKFRHADGTDTEIGTATPEYGPVRVVTTSIPNTGTYSSTTLKFTAGSNSALTLDSVTMANNDRVLIAVGNANDGIFTVTDKGSGSTPWIMTRVADMNASAEFINGALVAAYAGTVYGNTLWELSFTAPFTIDSTTPTFTQTATAVTFASVKNALALASAAVGFNGQKISSVSAPSAANDAANKSYVDNRFALSGGTSSASAAGTFVLSNSNGLSFGLNGSTLTGALPRVTFFENQKNPYFGFAAATGSGAANLSFQRFSVPYGLSATQLDLLAAFTAVASTHASYTVNAALYTFAGSTASSASSTAYAVSINSTVYTNYNSTRYRSVPVATWNLTPGEYLLGLMMSCNGPAGTTGTFSLYGGSSISIAGADGAAANYSNYFGPGIYTAATGAFPASVHMSDVAQTGASVGAQPYFRLVASGG